jgi:hypothetical protein
VRNGDPMMRFWNKVQVTESCWLWTGGKSHNGYGLFHWSRRQVRAHRFAYEMFVGPIPEGLTIDHLCRVPACVLPLHMEAVTIRENILRGEGRAAANARQTHCQRGHLFDEDNTYVRRGMRTCRECKSVALRLRRAKTRIAAAYEART